MIIRVKNMVCPRCVLAVENLLTEMQLSPQRVALGEAELTTNLLPAQKTTLALRLQQLGFELLEDAAAVLTEQIKNLVIGLVHHGADSSDSNINWSQFLSQQLHRDYSYLSKLFSETEGITIEQYIIRQKIERAKELLLNHELTLSQIAFEMNYSSTAHLSAQFKKITGLTPSQYKQQIRPQRIPLDGI